MWITGSARQNKDKVRKTVWSNQIIGYFKVFIKMYLDKLKYNIFYIVKKKSCWLIAVLELCWNQSFLKHKLQTIYSSKVQSPVSTEFLSLSLDYESLYLSLRCNTVAASNCSTWRIIYFKDMYLSESEASHSWHTRGSEIPLL